MIDLSTIRQARESLQGRQNDLVNTIRTRSGGRYSAENAATEDSWEGKFLGADQERGRQLDWLEQALSGGAGGFTSTVENEAATREKSNVMNAELQRKQVGGQATASAARSGQAGSSVDAGNQARMDAALSEAKVRAKAQADELRAAGIQGVDAMEKQLVDMIMEESGAFQAAQQAAIAGQQVDIQGAGMQSQLENQYRNILAQTLGSVLQTGGDFATTGFDAARNANDQSQRDWELWRAQGSRPGYEPTVTDNTWWRW